MSVLAFRIGGSGLVTKIPPGCRNLQPDSATRPERQSLTTSPGERKGTRPPKSVGDTRVV